MLMGRNALYYEDYILAIQRFNSVISAKPYLAEPYFTGDLQNSTWKIMPEPKLTVHLP